MIAALVGGAARRGRRLVPRARGSRGPVARVAAAAPSARRRPATRTRFPRRARPSWRRSPRAFNDLAEQLARAREAERSFLLSVSHELKTPLTAIRGYAEALREGAVAADDAAATIASEAERLGRLVGDLLDLARMNRPSSASHPTEIDLGEVAEDAVRRYEPQADALRRVAAASSPTARRRRRRTRTASCRSSRTWSRTRCG